MADSTATAQSYRYQLPGGQTVDYGDPTLNRGALAGATFVSGPGPDPLAAAAPAAPINRAIDQPTGADAAETYANTPPQSEAVIAEQKRQAAQGQIDAINKTYDDQVSQEKQAGQERLNANNSVSVLSGLMGSTEAVAAHPATAHPRHPRSRPLW
jgi:hypothetical protein